MNKIKKIIILLIGILLINPGMKIKNIEEINSSIISLQSTNKKEMKNIAIFIKFKDSNTNHLEEEQSIKNAEIIFNSDTLFEMDSVNGKIMVPSLKKYFEKQSYGKLSIKTEFFLKKNNEISIYQDENTIGYYLKYNDQNLIGYQSKEEGIKRETKLLENAVRYIEKEIENENLNPEHFDINADGKIDNIMLIVEGENNLPSNISFGDILWSHKSEKEINQTLLGKKIGAYNLLYATDYKETTGLFSMNRGTYGTAIHEFGHTLGFLDLYRYNSQAKPVGFYDIMGNVVGSNPQNFLTYFISEYNKENSWHSPLPTIRSSSKNVTIYKPKFEEETEQRAVKIMIEDDTEEYFIVEYYEKRNTYNTYTADESGLIIYRVNEKYKYSGNKEGNDHIYIFRPNENNANEALGDLTKATLNKNRNTFGIPLDSKDWTNQAITYSNGSNTGLVIKIVKETEESITFDVTFPEIEGNGSYETPYKIKDCNDFIYLMQQQSENKYYELESDLDFKNKNYPIIQFAGNLNGNDHTIKNINSKNTGLFQSIGNFNKETKIENIVLENITIYGEKGDYLGGLSSSAENVLINNIHIVNGYIKNTENKLNILASTGGLIGVANNTTTIRDSSVDMKIDGEKNIGGLIGLNSNAKIENCFITSVINGKENIGEVIGLQNITDEIYHEPTKVFYHSTDKKNAVGAIAIYSHNINALKESELSKGITEFVDVKELTLNISEKKGFYKKESYQIVVEDEKIVKYTNGTLEGLKSGTTKVYTEFQIGTRKKQFITNIIVLPKKTTVVYQTGVEKKGWLNKVINGTTSGTVGSGLRMEALKITLENQEYQGIIEYKSHIQKQGWESTWRKNGEISGTNLESLRLEAVQVRLTGELAENYDIYYRVHSQRFGWLDWAKNGASAGTSGFGFRVEAIQIKLVKKGGSAPGSTTRPYVSYDATGVSYQTQVQKKGWLTSVSNGETSGTVGQGFRMESLKINLKNQGFSGNIEYRTHIQKRGWESTWKKNGATSGTVGLGLRLEALQLRLTGNMAKEYDIYYRVQAQKFGWLGWAKNGESAGTAGHGYRLEAIQIVLVRKGMTPPGSTANHFYNK